MKYSILFRLLVIIPVIVSCASTNQQSERSVFTFSYQDNQFQIVGISAGDGAGVNDLLQKQNDLTVFWARDNNRDGRIDQILDGSLDMEKANEIYQFGINEAIKLGKYKEEHQSGVFETQMAGNRYQISSYHADTEEGFNKFIIYQSGRSPLIFIDFNFNGVLDMAEQGDAGPDEWQSAYQQILEAGLEDGSIVQKDGMYIVKIQDNRI